jgi:hypothetical protein
LFKIKRDYFNPADWLNSALLLVTLGIGIWSVQEAGWSRPTPSYIVILALAIFVGFILVKSRLPVVVALPIALVSGLIVVIWQGLMLFPEPALSARVVHFIDEIRLWWKATIYNAPTPVTIHIALIFGYLTWTAGYFSVWPLVQKHNPWTGVFLGAVIILVNLNFWLHEKYVYFLWYLIAALVFIAVVNYTHNLSRLAIRQHKGAGWLLWTTSSLCLIAVVLTVAWTNPGYRIAPISDYARARDPFKGSIQLYWQNFFASVPGSGIPTLVHGTQQDLHFTGSLDLSDQVVFIVRTDKSNYWKTQIYDVYNASGWKTGNVTEKIVKEGIPENKMLVSLPNSELRYTVIPQVNTGVLPLVGEFVAGDISVVDKNLSPRVFEIDFSDSSADSLLPPDIASTARTIRSTRANLRRTDQQIAALLPAGLKLVGVNRSSSTVVDSLEISRSPAENDTEVAIAGTQILVRQQPATIVVAVPPAVAPDELSKAGINYPKTVTDRYLQLPNSASITRIKALTDSITKNLTDPNQKAQAIKDYLSKYRYSLNITAPPPDADGVDYFLFTQKAGYCTYFASAMAVMLRSEGVPARLVVGFMPGQFDAETHGWIIRDRDYHAWTEVYFPGHGWERFDPTPAAALEDLTPDTAGSDPNIPGLDEFLSEEFDASQLNSVPAAGTTQANYTGLIIFMVFYVVFFLLFLILLKIASRSESEFTVYSKLVFLASLARMGPKSWQTAEEFSRRLSTAMPQYARTIHDIVGTYERSAYGYVQVNPSDRQFRRAWPGLRWALIKRVFRLK